MPDQDHWTARIKARSNEMQGHVLSVRGAASLVVITDQNLLGTICTVIIDLRMGCKDLALPSIDITRLWTNERNFILYPKQQPFAAILAYGNVALVVSAIDVQDGQARNAMALQILAGEVEDLLRAAVARQGERRQSGGCRCNEMPKHLQACMTVGRRRSWQSPSAWPTPWLKGTPANFRGIGWGDYVARAKPS